MEIHGDSQTSAAVRDPAALSKKSAATDAPFTVSLVSTQELDSSTGGRKDSAFPRAAPLKKAAVLLMNQSSMSSWAQNDRE